MNKKILTIILARGGSKGLKLKNIKKLNGKPLIYYPIKASLSSKLVNRTIVSTDNETIRKTAMRIGAESPFLRPKKYAKDNSSSEEALSHCLKWLKENEKYKPDYVVYMQITEPFRSKDLIDNGIKKIINSNLDSVFAVNKSHKNFWIYKNKSISRINSMNNNYLPRQLKKPIYIENTGSFLISKASIFLNRKRIGKKIGIIIEKENIPYIDIHSEYDLKLAELIIKNYKAIYNNKNYKQIIL
tara:strand:- start:33 stop:761 length:729 start_codon:yes stop_codon:yes gene_type:complete